MALSNDSITVTPGSGASVATHLAGGKEHQVVMIAADSGHIIGSNDTYFYNIPSTVHVAAANTVMWDLWNGSTNKAVRVVSIRQIPNIVTAVTGIVFAWQLQRTTAIGTGGTAQTAWLPDTTKTALDANITLRLKPTGGATGSTTLLDYSLSSEETNAATIQIASQGGLELVPESLRNLGGIAHGIKLNPSQGLRCVQVTNSAAGNTGWFITITVE